MIWGNGCCTYHPALVGHSDGAAVAAHRQPHTPGGGEAERLLQSNIQSNIQSKIQSKMRYFILHRQIKYFICTDGEAEGLVQRKT